MSISGTTIFPLPSSANACRWGQTPPKSDFVRASSGSDPHSAAALLAGVHRCPGLWLSASGGPKDGGGPVDSETPPVAGANNLVAVDCPLGAEV